MTDEEIDAMEAGEDLDHAIAEDVFGFPVFREQKDGKLYLGASRMHHEWRELPRYSTDIAAAWQVVERMRQLGLAHQFGETLERDMPFHWYLIKTGYFCLYICRHALKCCKAVADKKEDAVEASPLASPVHWWT